MIPTFLRRLLLGFSYAALLTLTSCDSGGGDDSDEGDAGDRYELPPIGTNGVDTSDPVFDGEVQLPTFSPASGSVTALTEIAISCATSGATIYYTTDGSDPTPASARYDATDKPKLFEDSTFKALAVVGSAQSEVATAAYIVEPILDGFDFALESGMRWSYHYEYRHNVNYSMFRDQSFSSEKDFEVILGDSVEIDGITAFEVIVGGDFTIDWNYLALDQHRLLGSVDGTSFTVLLDAMLGYWPGRGFFHDFGDDKILSATDSGDIISVASGWRYTDDDTAYYPGVGTIYDPDAMSIYSNEEEKYKKNVGPYGYRTSKGVTDEYESASDTYEVELTAFDTGVDYAMYSTNQTISSTGLKTLTQEQEVDYIEVKVGSTEQSYLIYVEFLTSGYNPVVSVLDKDYEFIYEDADTPAESGTLFESFEVLVTSAVSEKFYVWVSDKNGGASGEYQISVVPFQYPDVEANIEIYEPTAHWNLDLGYIVGQTLDAPGTIHAYSPSSGFATSKLHYIYAVPRSETLDLVVALIDLETSTYHEIIDAQGPGVAEAILLYPPDSDMVVEVFDKGYDTMGDYVLGYGN